MQGSLLRNTPLIVALRAYAGGILSVEGNNVLGSAYCPFYEACVVLENSTHPMGPDHAWCHQCPFCSLKHFICDCGHVFELIVEAMVLGITQE